MDATAGGIAELLNLMDSKADAERTATVDWADAVEAERVGQLAVTATASDWADINGMKGTLETASTNAANAVTNADAQIGTEK